jgi:diguanylate cyclase (GGDEF)-like protein/PAS domain S-box-containing protein
VNWVRVCENQQTLTLLPMESTHRSASVRRGVIRFLSPPSYPTPEETRQASVLQTCLLLVLCTSLLAGPVLIATSEDPKESYLLIGFLIALDLSFLGMVRRGKARTARILFPYSIWFVLTVSAFVQFGDIVSPPVDAFVLVIISGGLFLGWRHAYALVGLSLLSFTGLWIYGSASDTPTPVGSLVEVRAFVFYLCIYILAAALVHIATRQIQSGLKAAEKHQKELERRNQELQDMRVTLEERVEERTEEILRQKNFLQALVDFSPIAIVSLDPEQRIIASNPAFESMYGYTAEELVGQVLDGLITDDSTRSEASEFTRLVASGTALREMSVRYRHDGSPIQVEIFGVPVVLEGEQIGVLGLYNDITERVKAERALRESEEQYRSLFSNIAIPVFIFDKETYRFLDANPAAVERYGYSVEEFLEMTPTDLHHPDEAVSVLGMVAYRHDSSPIEYTHCTKSGGRIVAEIRTTDLEYHGRPARISIIHDISDRMDTERALRQSELKLRSIIEQSYDSITLTDEEGIVTVWNQAQEKLTGLRSDEVIGRPLWEVKKFINAILEGGELANGGHHLQKQLVDDLLMSGRSSWLSELREWEVFQSDGSRRYAQSVFFPVETDKGFLAGAITRDITEKKLIEKRFEYLATHDWLTNLPNRSLFQDRLHHAIALAQRENRQVAVLFMDLDGFKAVNDEFGHARGDTLLRVVGERLRGCLRGSDTVARLGGDEFTFILENIAYRHEILTVVEKIHICLSKPFRVEGTEFGISASIGISLFPEDAYEPEALLKLADQAMYQAKQEGKDRYQFYSQTGVSSIL